MTELITNDQLTVTIIPSPKSKWPAIQNFALTYDGYESWGSFEKCAEVANAGRCATLTELRTCLFFEQRRWRHFGESPDREAMKYIRGLVEGIHGKVQAQDID
jgi:hypothetical protein